jgi:hypothetical protein
MRSALVLTLLIGFFGQTSARQSPPSYVLDRTAGQGKLWLGWMPAERQSFILGYLWAYHSGFTSGCRVYFDANPPKTLGSVEQSPLQRCMLQELHYSREASSYEREITGFYEKFPSDSDVPISWLFQAFSDSEHKAPNEIHSAWSHGHSHP